jgi:hypothetical protein
MFPIFPAAITPNPAPDYHWSPANQRAFLETLAITGNASHAAQAVSMSKHSAYRLRFRRDGRADGQARAPSASELTFARIASQDFEAYLDLIEAGGAATQLSLFLAARSDLASVLSGSNLAQISADIAEEEDVFPSAEPINRITL